MAEDKPTDTSVTDEADSPAAEQKKPALKGKKAIKEALNKADTEGKAAKMRKARKRNDLRAEAYHAAKRGFKVPTKVLILMGLVVVTVILIMVTQYQAEQEDRALVNNVYIAAKNGDYPAVRKFLDSHPEFSDMPDNTNSTLMHYGAMAGSVEICRAVLELNGSISRINDARRMPIHYAAESGNSDVVRMLINRDTFVTLPDKDGMQPIHIAARQGNPDVIRMLLNSRSKVDAHSSFLMTPLHHAVQAGNLEAVKAILEFGPKVNELNSHGYTPLHIAVICDHKEVAKHLIAAGADSNYASNGTATPMDMVKEKNDPDFEAILKTSQVDMLKQLFPDKPSEDSNAQPSDSGK